MASSTDGALLAEPSFYNVKNGTSFFVEKYYSESFEEKTSLKNQEIQTGVFGEVNYRSQQDSGKQKESSYAVKITLASAKIENQN